jgi:predicted ABC-type ATPase
MKTSNPNVVVIGGPNRAGKTTAAPILLHDSLDVTTFVNADLIARDLSASNPEEVAFKAGRLMLQRLNTLAADRANFAFETTLASRSFAPWLRDLRRDGYDVDVVFLWLPTADLAVARVRDRALRGGHDVPEETIRRRYRSGLRNFLSLYRRVATSWRFYENTEPTGPRLVATGEGTAEVIALPELWSVILESIT